MMAPRFDHLPLVLVLLLMVMTDLTAQSDSWQQRIVCTMDVDVDHIHHRYTGTQQLVYENRSPDTLDRMFFHLYPNAFQPNSEMDQWIRRLPDPDMDVLQKIASMGPEDVGYLHVSDLTMNGLPLESVENRTILEVRLTEPIPPGRSAVFGMSFQGQIPIQTRRSGRFNAEGIDYSMAQWFPKVCHYDERGWHATPYVQREFYGEWGDYDVTIHMDPAFVLGGTGYLQNPQEVGAGYEDPDKPLVPVQGPKKRWHFLAPNVHDFVWAADPEYTHVTKRMHDGTVFHFLYVPTEENRAAWEALPALVDTALVVINARFGPYPYRQYSVIQGGDGGMEYPMATLISGGRNFRGLAGVTIHELMHSWYQMVLATNESLYAWMDEGFTSYASAEVQGAIFSPGTPLSAQASNYNRYFGLARSGLEEPLTTHADHFLSNYAYAQGSYGKGAVFLHQLGYIIGREALEATLLKYFHTWQFRHPTPVDFIRIAEQVSGQELDWYLEGWINTTRQIDYGVDTAWTDRSGLHIVLRQKGTMPMPVDLAIETGSGITRITIPLDIQRGEKTRDRLFTPDLVGEDWPWTFEQYHLLLPAQGKEPIRIIIDPTRRMADVRRDDNEYLIE